VDNDMPPLIYEGLDPVPKTSSGASKILREASRRVGEAACRVEAAIEAGRRPGMPLSVLSNMAREAPLGSLLIAFLLGIAVGRRTHL
jgi:hypothetical protein